MSVSRRVWIQGAGEMASAAAVALLAAGHRVVMAEIDNPLSVRRLVCFSEAVYEGRTTVAGWTGELVPAAALAWAGGEARVAVDPGADQLSRLAPDVVVDARMTKRAPDPLPAGGRPVIGLGPGFLCGRDADLIVETMRGADMGRVIFVGAAAPYTGQPGKVAGHDSDRLLRAPAAGRLEPVRRIGDLVAAGDVVGRVAGIPVTAGLAGLLRGLIHSRAELVAGEKVGDVDPRGAAVDPAALTDKALRVGMGVREAVERLGRRSGGPGVVK